VETLRLAFQYSAVVNFREPLSRKRKFRKGTGDIVLATTTMDHQPVKEATMYHPGLWQLAQIRCAELLEEAARERAARRAQTARPKPFIPRLAVAFAAAPIVLGIVWMLVAR
jgi:hypothetical protein